MRCTEKSLGMFVSFFLLISNLHPQSDFQSTEGLGLIYFCVLLFADSECRWTDRQSLTDEEIEAEMDRFVEFLSP